MRDLIRRILKEESKQLDMMHYWKNAPKVTDMTDQKMPMELPLAPGVRDAQKKVFAASSTDVSYS